MGWRGGGWSLCASFEFPTPCPPCPFVFRVPSHSITFALSSPAGCDIKKPSKVRWSTGIARFPHALVALLVGDLLRLWLCLWTSFCPCLCPLVHLAPFAESMSSAYLRLWGGRGLVHVGCHLYSFMPPPPPHYVLQSVFSSGSIFCFVVVVSLVAYVGGGMLYKRLTKGAALPAGIVLFRVTNSAVVACVCPVLL